LKHCNHYYYDFCKRVVSASSAAIFHSRIKDPFSKVVGELFRKAPVRSFIHHFARRTVLQRFNSGVSL